MNITNRKAKYDYHFLRSEVAGIQLVGSEVKAIRRGDATLVDSHCYFQKGELFVKGLNISETKSAFGHEASRVRKLLLKKKELVKLSNDLEKGMTILVYRLFCNERGYIKAEVVLAKGKKDYDKRETIKKRDADREMKRV